MGVIDIRVRRLTAQLLFICLLFSCFSCSLAVAAPSYDDIRAMYFKLRNTDADVLKVQDWRDSADALVKVRGKGRGEAELFALISYGELFRVYRLPMYFKSAEELFRKISSDKHFSQSPQRDELLKEWRRILELGGKRDEASKIGRLLSEPREAAITGTQPAAGGRRGGSKLVMIDPGHGGEDHGALGPGIMEKEVVLDVALRLEQALEQYPQISVRLTRRDDRFVPLQERANIANDYSAAAFISLHTNASPDKKAEGIETYVLDNSGDEATKSLAERENSVLKFEGAADLQFILSDLIQTSKTPDSYSLADAVQKSLISSIANRFAPPRNLGVRKAPFYVLVGAHMPCILVELSFIDHEREGLLLADKQYRQGLANAVAIGTAKYFGIER